MDKKVMIPFTVFIIFTTLLSPVLAKTTETSHYMVKGAYAKWSEGTVLVYELKQHGPGFKEKIILLEVLLIDDETPILSVFKELAPSEFKWSLSSCWVSTEIGDHNLLVEWETVLPTMNDHLNDKDEMLATHHIDNSAGRSSSATLEWGELQLNEGSLVHADVGRDISAEIIK